MLGAGGHRKEACGSSTVRSKRVQRMERSGACGTPFEQFVISLFVMAVSTTYPPNTPAHPLYSAPVSAISLFSTVNGPSCSSAVMIGCDTLPRRGP